MQLSVFSDILEQVICLTKQTTSVCQPDSNEENATFTLLTCWLFWIQILAEQSTSWDLTMLQYYCYYCACFDINFFTQSSVELSWKFPVGNS